MKCGGQCENLKLQMGDYSLKAHMFSIEIRGYDIILGVEWQRTLGLITMDFLELDMILHKDEHSYTPNGLKTISL